MMSKDEFKENLEADLDYEESQGSSGQFSSAEERDEIKEVQKMSRKDNLLVQGWRIATTVVLLVTAFIVAYTTYRFLKTEEQQSFEDAVSSVLTVSSVIWCFPLVNYLNAAHVKQYPL